MAWDEVLDFLSKVLRPAGLASESIHYRKEKKAAKKLADAGEASQAEGELGSQEQLDASVRGGCNSKRAEIEGGDE